MNRHAPTFSVMSLSQATLTSALLLSLLLTGCGLTGYGAAQPADGNLSLSSPITPRTKGGTLNITPQSKGGTLKGSIVWPTEVAGLASKRFLIKVYENNALLAEGATDATAHFVLTGVPASSELRIEAHVPGRPNVILRRLVQTPSTAEGLIGGETGAQLSMLTTAAAAVLADARHSGSPLQTLSAERLLESDAAPALTPLALLMTPYLDAALSSPIENLTPVQTAIEVARIELEKVLSSP